MKDLLKVPATAHPAKQPDPELSPTGLRPSRSIPLERTAKRLLMPVTTPRMRRVLIDARNRGAGGVAALRTRTSPHRLDPGFLIVGAQKAGTTFLYLELLRHPQVRPALTKEVQYFSEHFDRGHDWYRGFFPAVSSSAPADGPIVCGDATPEYMFHPHGGRRIAAELPDAKLVVLLRDPVKRAYSQFQHERRLGYEPCPSFEQALAQEERRIRGEADRMRAESGYVSYPLWHFAYRLRGHYVEQLQALYDEIDPARIQVLIAEELYADSCRVVGDVVDFLGLAPWQPQTPGRNDMEAKSPAPMSDAARDELTAYFRPRNQQLAELLGRELPWASA